MAISFDLAKNGYAIYSRGSTAEISEVWHSLPNVAQDKIMKAGFYVFLDTLPVAELGELTLTPIDFMSITGLRVRGQPIPQDLEIRSRPDYIQAILGWSPKFVAGGGVWAYEVLKINQYKLQDEEEVVFPQMIGWRTDNRIRVFKDDRLLISGTPPTSMLSTELIEDDDGFCLMPEFRIYKEFIENRLMGLLVPIRCREKFVKQMFKMKIEVYHHPIKLTPKSVISHLGIQPRQLSEFS
ncbi:hypothetical protein M9H77_24126 [Catharanthus roseus]|uniref:Uncharacterized protein n=1 Tax=Catharanthus roseus TaxID=4058 RepID=A0ACC0AXZ7_CATRO|nr:hypothetical protein M9H77_24126 [Catharanthus roseus]